MHSCNATDTATGEATGTAAGEAADTATGTTIEETGAARPFAIPSGGSCSAHDGRSPAPGPAELPRRHPSAPPSAFAQHPRAPAISCLVDDTVVTRWVTTLLNPLLPPTASAQARQQMAALVDGDLEWSASYLAGLLGALAHSLPADDPWRHLNARLNLGQIAGSSAEPCAQPAGWRGHLIRLPLESHADLDSDGASSLKEGENETTHQATGAWLFDGRAFGALADVGDLDRMSCADPTLHPRLGAVAQPLAPLASALLVAASQPVRVTQHVFGRAAHALRIAASAGSITSAGTALTECADAALRWLAYRRECYTGANDYLLELASTRWITLTDAYMHGGPLHTLHQEFADAVIPAGAWAAQTVLPRWMHEPRPGFPKAVR